MADSVDAFIETGIDRLLTYLRKEGRVQSAEAAASLDVDEDTVLNWARALQKSGLVTVTYSAREGKIIQLADGAADNDNEDADGTAVAKNARVRRLHREEAKIERYLEVIKRFRHQLDRDESFAQDLREALSADDDETVDTYLADIQQLEGELEGVLADIDGLKDDMDDLESLAEQIGTTAVETASPGLFGRVIGKLRPGHAKKTADGPTETTDVEAEEEDPVDADTATETTPEPPERPRTTLPHSMDPDVEEPAAPEPEETEPEAAPVTEPKMDIEAELTEEPDDHAADTDDEDASAHPHLAAAASSFRNLLGSKDEDDGEDDAGEDTSEPEAESEQEPEPEPEGPREDAPDIDTVIEKTIPEVRADVIHYRLDPAAVLEAEESGKDRKTLKSWLRDEMGDAA